MSFRFALECDHCGLHEEAESMFESGWMQVFRGKEHYVFCTATCAARYFQKNHEHS